MIFDLLKKDGLISNSRELMDYFASGGQSSAGVSVDPASMSKHGTVVALISVMQRAAGQLPLNLFESKGDKREKAINHPLQDLFTNGPNQFMTKQEWIQLIIRQLFLYGNHYSFINRTSKGIAELLPLDPNSVEPVLDENFNVLYKVTFPDKTQNILEPSEVLHFKIGMKTPIMGCSPFAEAKDSVGLSIALERFASKLFSNGARPGGILSAPVLTTEQTEQIKEDWNSAYGGVENANRVAVLSGGLAWQSVGMSSDDAQFIDTKRVSRNELAGMIGVPPHMIGGMENATFSNIEHQAIEFVIHALNPVLVGIEERIRKTLLTDKERKTYYAKFNVNAILRGDMKARSDFYTKMLQNGAFSPNEIRNLEDMNPRENGDIYLTPMNMTINAKPEGNPNDE
jgi:HK97 family phage portal protein